MSETSDWIEQEELFRKMEPTNRLAPLTCSLCNTGFYKPIKEDVICSCCKNSNRQPGYDKRLRKLERAVDDAWERNRLDGE